MTAYLRNHIDNLRQEAAAQNEIARDMSSQREPKTYIPLKDQITELMSTLPSALRNKPWSMQELTQRLNGKYRDRPHAQMVGIALRQLGWTRKRLWNIDHQGVRLWIPPKQS